MENSSVYYVIILSLVAATNMFLIVKILQLIKSMRRIDNILRNIHIFDQNRITEIMGRFEDLISKLDQLPKYKEELLHSIKKIIYRFEYAASKFNNIIEHLHHNNMAEHDDLRRNLENLGHNLNEQLYLINMKMKEIEKNARDQARDNFGIIICLNI